MNRFIPVLAALIVTISVSMIGCSGKDDYMFGLYEEDEVRELFRDNTELFCELADVVVNEPRFREEGRRDEYYDAYLFTPNDKNLELFSEQDRGVILKFFEFKPYLISSEVSGRWLEITFINAAQDGGYVFRYWIGSETEDKLRSQIDLLESMYDVYDLSGNWYLTIPK